MSEARSGDAPGTEQLSRRERYEKLVRAAEMNVGGPETPMRAGVKRSSLLQTASSHGRYGGMLTAYRAAIENEDLLPWKARDGTVRLTPTSDEALEDLIDEERERLVPCAELIERARELQDGAVENEEVDPDE